MKSNLRKVVAMVIVAVIVLIPVGAFAIDYDVPDGASTKSARFSVVDDFDAPGVEFSMLSEDGELVIHISEDTIIYFEDFVVVRDVIEEGQTLAGILDGRNLVVTYSTQTLSLPPQTSPISIKVLYETIVPLTPTATNEIPFLDVSQEDWFFNPVAWAYENEIMNGISQTAFAPGANMTRAMLVTVLWRYAGRPEAGVSTFQDVRDGTWYTTAVAWAAENDIVLGYNEATFGVNDPITREQMYTILYRYMEFSELTIELDEEMRLVNFADEDDISDWAKDALFFMYDAGVMFRESTLDNYARPRETALRGEIAGAMFFFDMYSIPIAEE